MAKHRNDMGKKYIDMLVGMNTEELDASLIKFRDCVTVLPGSVGTEDQKTRERWSCGV